MSDFLTRRNGTWHFQRRVPIEYVHLDKRIVVRHSTKVRIAKDKAGVRAGVVADRINRGLEAYWAGLASGADAGSLPDWGHILIEARRSGFSYLDHHAVLNLPFEQKLARVEALGSEGRVNNPVAVSALMGTAERPVPRISQIATEYESEVKESMHDMSPDQIRIWRNGRKRATETFLQVIGKDKKISELAHDDAVTYREHWRERVIDGEVVAKTANREIGQLSGMLKELSLVRRLSLPDLFHGLRLKGEAEKDPTPFEQGFIQKVILAEDSLADMNEEARMLVYIMVDSGMRPSEILNLNETTIFLDEKTPYVKVLADGRRLKTEHSAREIPLVGCALPAMKIMRNGFKHYYDNPSGLSATVNKYFAENGMKPTPDHTLYSLRHSFKDRLISIEAQDSLIDGLMGHDSKKPRYGRGASLELKLKYLKKIALKPPRSLLKAV